MTTPRHREEDWPFIQNGAVNLFLSPAVLDAAVASMKEAGYRIHEIDCGSEAAFVSTMAVALRWEQKFGYQPHALNLDALNDALRHEPATDGLATLLVLRNFDALRKRGKEVAHNVLDLIELNARDHLLLGAKLVCFVRTRDPDLSIDNLGARSAHWNASEWLDAKRHRSARRKS